VFKRLFWLSTGTVLGMGSSFWVMRTLRQIVRRSTPGRLAAEARSGLTGLRTDLVEAADEGRRAMRQREASLRAELAHPR